MLLLGFCTKMSRERKERMKQELRKLTRRKFLKIGLATAAGLALTYLGSHNFRRGDKWAFLTRAENLTVLDINQAWDEVTINGVPLSPEREIPRGSKEDQEFLKKKEDGIKRLIAKYGMTKPEVAKVTRQEFGMPEDLDIAEGYKKYIERCRKYLFEKLPMLERVSLEIIVLRKGQNFSNSSGKGYVGLSHHYVQRGYFTDHKTGQGFITGKVLNSIKSHTVTEYHRKTNKRGRYFVFFGIGENALSAPFSESIHLATSIYAHPHSQKAGMEKGKIADEAIAEGISQLITEEAIKEFAVPRGKEIMASVLEKIKDTPSYVLIPNSIEWLRRNGIEQGLALYMEDPGKYLEAIQR